jgi:hypothetical protein
MSTLTLAELDARIASLDGIKEHYTERGRPDLFDAELAAKLELLTLARTALARQGEEEEANEACEGIARPGRFPRGLSTMFKRPHQR